MRGKLTPQSVIAGLLVLAPLAMTVARRSSTLLLVAGALAVFVTGRKSLAERWRNARIDPALLAGLLTLAGWASVSLLWSPLPVRGAKQLVFDFIAPVAAGLLLLADAHPVTSERARRAFTVAMIVASSMIAAQILFQFRIEALFNAKESHGEIWRFNMVLVTLGLMLPALLLMARHMPFWSGLALLALAVASGLSQSATAKTLLVTGTVAYIAFSLLPRRLSLILSAVALLAILAAQPWQGRLVEQVFQQAGQTDILFQSAKERVVIWKATGEMTLHAMPWGTGMGSSDAVSETPFAKTLPPDLWVGLRQTHAHDAFLNVLMELGLPGLIGLALIAIGLLRTLSRLPDALFAPAMALATQVVTVDLISHGAWQAWWFTAIMLAVLALRQNATAARDS